MRYIALLLMALFVSGCATTPEPKIIIKREIVEVKVPVAADCPEPPVLPERASLPIRSLTKDDKKDFNKISESFVKSLIILDNENKKLRTIIESYRHDDK